ncbi:hypothetical protein PANDA_003957 [Ailuropoda melanoleuca]|uniref:Uncharacterized protein n=1 Tax=Ailuropoda melanoleuca TaxID=9646 RepID=D2H2T2_AILME|nr:hypothetical protein PANDA_003957 [Ailuropoda melanoleuca]
MEEKSKVNFLGFAVLPHCEPLSRDSLGDHWDSSRRNRGFSGSNLGLDSFCTAQEADQFGGANLAEYVFSLLDHILSPPPMPFRKCSNPDVTSVPAKSLKFKRQLSEDGRELRRGSLGGALTGRYLLPNPVAGQAWPASAETSNLVRMRNQALGQSAPLLTASLRSIHPYAHGSCGAEGSLSGWRYLLVCPLLRQGGTWFLDKCVPLAATSLSL